MKLVMYCNCGQRATLEVVKISTVYDLKFGWVCSFCKKVNEVQKDVWRE